MKDYSDYNLLRHNTFGMDVKARRFVEYDSEDELCRLIPTLQGDVLHIGGGSNLLFRGDYGGTVLHSGIKGIGIEDENEDSVLVRVGAGEVWDEFVEWAVERGFGGVENLSLIPGEVGASAVQNIGAYGVEAKDVIVLVEAVELQSGQKRCFGTVECDYAYRQSIFKRQLKDRYAITYVTYRLQKSPSLKLDYGNIRTMLEGKRDISVADVRKAIIDIRNTKLPDPKVQGNAGSFFMNPIVSREKFLCLQREYPQMPYYETEGGVKIPAGWMIEQCGWKGRALGKAGVHDKQALVLVNLGGATSEDIIRLCETICKDVSAKFGINIHPEVNFI